MGDIFSTTRGGFSGVWQPLQIGHRRVAPLPQSSSLRCLRLSLLKGEQRRERWDLNGGGETCCSQFKVLAITRWMLKVLKVYRKLARREGERAVVAQSSSRGVR